MSTKYFISFRKFLKSSFFRFVAVHIDVFNNAKMSLWHHNYDAISIVNAMNAVHVSKSIKRFILLLFLIQKP